MNVDDNPFIKNRPSTRVKHAPGGDSSLSFGNYDSKNENSSNQSGRNNNDLIGESQRQRENQGSSNNNNNNNNNSGSNQNKNEQNKGDRQAAGNLDTNRTNSSNDKRTNVKVNQPPGGASSIIFG